MVTSAASGLALLRAEMDASGQQATTNKETERDLPIWARLCELKLSFSN